MIGSAAGGDGCVKIHQDVKLFVAYLQKHTLNYACGAERKLWIQLVKGQIQINHHLLEAGDGAAVEKEEKIELVCDKHAELLLFDLDARADVKK